MEMTDTKFRAWLLKPALVALGELQTLLETVHSHQHKIMATAQEIKDKLAEVDQNITDVSNDTTKLLADIQALKDAGTAGLDDVLASATALNDRLAALDASVPE